MKKALAFLFLSSILLRLWFGISYWADKPLTHDAQEYLELAQNFNETGHFSYEPSQTLQIEQYGRAPGYPFWLSVLLRISPSLAWLRLAEIAVSLVSCYLFFLLARVMFHVRAGLIAFLISSFYLPLIWLIPVLLSENLWIMVMLMSYLCLLRARNHDSGYLIDFLLSFLLLATASLIRPATIFLIPVYFLWTVQFADWKKAILMVLIYFAALLPWNLHLYRQEGRFVFIASEGGVTFWTGTHPLYSGEGDLSVNPPVQKEYRDLLKEHLTETPAQREKLYFHQALQNIFQHPIRYIMIEGKKLLCWILPIGPSVLETSWLHRMAGICFYVPLMILSLLGFKSLRKEIRWFILGIICSFTVMILIFFPQERFRIATIDPILILIVSNELNRRFGVTLRYK
jgi:4-amino-4-deoxy-L-arabinose transferase-like glycosyltransferase